MPRRDTPPPKTHRRPADCVDRRAGVRVLPSGPLRHAVPNDASVMTARGALPIHALRSDDRIVTRDTGLCPLFAVLDQPIAGGLPMVRVAAHAFAVGRPARDIVLPLDQAVVLRDWRTRTLFRAREAWVALGRLCDGRILREATGPATTYRALVLERPTAIRVDGLDLVCAGRAGASTALGL